MKWLKPLLVCLVASLATSCETTTSYGYFVDRFNEDSILYLFQLHDASVNERDFSTYESLVGPRFAIHDTLATVPTYISRSDHLKQVKEVLAYAESVRVSSFVTDIVFSAPDAATATVQEDVRIQPRFGPARHIVTIKEIDVGFEEGWIYFTHVKRTAEQEYHD